jgi:hypothetical protein
MKKVNLFLVILVVLLVGLSSCGGGGAKNINTINDLKGTTWQNSSSNNYPNFWYKVVINNNNTYDAWYSNPSDGKWNNHHSGSYEIKEDRDSSNGDGIFILTLHKSKLPGVQYLIVYKPKKYESGYFRLSYGVFSANPFIGLGYDTNGIGASLTNINPWN